LFVHLSFPRLSSEADWQQTSGVNLRTKEKVLQILRIDDFLHANVEKAKKTPALALLLHLTKKA
jgi:hypothetical protein